MNELTSEELAKLLSMLAYGFVARWGYLSQLVRKEEEHTITVIWAVVWSAILRNAFNLPGWGFSKQSIHSDLSRQSLAFTVNILLSLVIGTLVGRVILMRTLIKTDRIEGFRAQARFWWQHLFAFQTRDHRSVIDRNLNKNCKGKWVILETKANRYYLGWISENDACDTDNYHLALSEAVLADPATGKTIPESEWSSIVFSAEEVRSIRPLP